MAMMDVNDSSLQADAQLKFVLGSVAAWHWVCIYQNEPDQPINVGMVITGLHRLHAVDRCGL